MKLFTILKTNTGKKKLLICGRKILTFSLNRYDKLYTKRFTTEFTIQELRYLLSYQFKQKVGYKPNLNHPTTLNEKITWLKLYDRNPLMTICADKYLVRKYVEEKIGSNYLIPLLGYWKKAEDIDFSSLPQKFVLKVNWGSGQNIIIRNKDEIDTKQTIERLNGWLRPEANHYYSSFEWCYKDIKPCIIAEKYIEEFDNQVYDYKFYCFNGKAFLLMICGDRATDLFYNYYDMDFNFINLRYDGHRNNPNLPLISEKILNRMKKLSEILSADFINARVDFYQINGEIKFGELTFYSGSGMDSFDPVSWDYHFGKMLTLTEGLTYDQTSD